MDRMGSTPMEVPLVYIMILKMHHARTHTHAHARARARTHTHTHTHYTHARTHASKHARTHARTHARSLPTPSRAHLHAHTCACTYVYCCMCTCIHKYRNLRTHITNTQTCGYAHTTKTQNTTHKFAQHSTFEYPYFFWHIFPYCLGYST